MFFCEYKTKSQNVPFIKERNRESQIRNMGIPCDLTWRMEQNLAKPSGNEEEAVNKEPL